MGCSQSQVIVAQHCPLDAHVAAGHATDIAVHDLLRGAYLNCRSVAEIRKSVLRLKLPIGIPHHARFWLYQHLSGGALLDQCSRHRLSHSAVARSIAYDSLYQALLAQGRPPADVDRTICNDVYRTLPQYSFFGPRARPGPGQSQLYRILTAYAHCDSALGYTQGMNFLAALLLLAGLPEEAAFYAFTGLMVGHGLRALFAPGLPATFAVQEGVEAHVRAKHPLLAAAIFDTLGVSTSMFVPTWLLSLFLSSPLPPSSALLVLDTLLLESLQPVQWAKEAERHHGYTEEGCTAGCKYYSVLEEAPFSIGASWPCCVAPVIEALATGTPIPALPLPASPPSPSSQPVASPTGASEQRQWGQYLGQGKGKAHVLIRACAALVVVHKETILSRTGTTSTQAPPLDSDALYSLIKNSEGVLVAPIPYGKGKGRERHDSGDASSVSTSELGGLAASGGGRRGSAQLSQWDLEVAAGLHDGVSGLVHAAVHAKGAKQETAPAIIGHPGNIIHPHAHTTHPGQPGGGGHGSHGTNGPQSGAVSELKWQGRPPSAPLVRGQYGRHGHGTTTSSHHEAPPAPPTPVPPSLNLSQDPSLVLSPSTADATSHGVLDTLSPQEQEGPPQYSLVPEPGLHEWGAAVIALRAPTARLEAVPESPCVPPSPADARARGAAGGRKLLAIGHTHSSSAAAVHPSPPPVSISTDVSTGRVSDGTGAYIFPARAKWMLHAGHGKAMRVHVHGGKRQQDRSEGGDQAEDERMIVWTCDGRIVPHWAPPKVFLKYLC